MNIVSTYLNFKGQTREAFEYYRNTFRSEYAAPIMTYGEIP